ncbi:MAG TPA: glycosyltransferase 87 family protein [Acidobacteriaceae bacterium]
MIWTTKLSTPQSGLVRVLRVGIAAVSSLVILLFLYTALRRLHYPYELEQLEGYMFLSSLRVFHGQSVYPHPSLAFIPYMYPPGYYYAAAAIGKLMGMSISALRMTSILSTLGCFAAIYALVWTEVRKHLPAIAAAGLYASCYTICQEWFDLGRLDSFFVLLVLLAMFATRRMHPVIAALLWALAFQTKQSILPVAFVMLCCNWREIRRTLAGVITLALAAGGSVLWLNRATQHWYSFYVFTIPKANADIKLRAAFIFWPTDLLRPLALALIVIVAAILFTRPSLQSRATRFYLTSASLIPLFWWIRTHSGSTVNSLMPVYALLAILFGIAWSRLMDVAASIPTAFTQPALLLLLFAVFSQEAAGIYNPGDYLPPASTRASIQAVVAQVQSLPGDVYVSEHPYYAWLSGKPAHADLVSLHDAMRAATPARTELRTEMETAIEDHAFTAIVLDQPASGEQMDTILGKEWTKTHDWRSEYTLQQNITGVVPQTKPNWIMARCLPGTTVSCPQ